MMRGDQKAWGFDRDDRDAWFAHLCAWPRHEVYAHPDYLALYAGPKDTLACLHYTEPEGEIIFPLILRDIAALPFAGEPYGGRLDAITAPFGYGGPFARTDGDAGHLCRGFFAAYAEWARDVGLVSEYTTFSPTTGITTGYPGEVAARLPIVVKDLQTSDLFGDIAKSQKRSVRRARDVGVTFEVDPEARHLAAFMEVWTDTSARYGGFLGGHAVSPDFIQRLLRALGRYAVFFHARHEGRIVSSELVLLTGDTVDFFRGGTLSEAMNTRANPLLKYEICEWGRHAGFRWYLLGGGNSADPSDSLFAYEKSFAPSGVRMLQTGRWVIDADCYGQLAASRQRCEDDRGHRFDLGQPFFPVYRAPASPPGSDA